ncbi:hypothetical protein [Deinococcus ficus]|uniref:DUF7878 domain-containing protein n=1 Tax=Deinococcus ficus TaxID=317577 RepID=A0A221SWY4_9DEIO|nr:hypothetical protein [Deinococcus ficus]ASN81150.1 hypothetical protein DFI_09150 [Deinococcus ficus]
MTRGLDIEFIIGKLVWYNRDYSGALPVNFEAEPLTIRVGGANWFSDFVAVGELMVTLEHWLDSEIAIQQQGFAFHSIDTEDNPVLLLAPTGRGTEWTLRQFDPDAPVMHLPAGDVEQLLRNWHDTIAAKIRRQFGEVHVTW